jgi:hypothetical protein
MGRATRIGRGEPKRKLKKAIHQRNEEWEKRNQKQALGFSSHSNLIFFGRTGWGGRRESGEGNLNENSRKQFISVMKNGKKGIRNKPLDLAVIQI